MAKKIFLLIIVLITLALFGLAIYYSSLGKILKEKFVSQEEETATSTDRIAIFYVAGGAKSPVFAKTLEVNPYYKVKEGEKQTFSIWAKDNVGVEKVTATIATDNGNEIIELKLFEGTGQEGMWQGSWKTKNISANYSYLTEFIAENIKGESTKLTISWTTE